MIAGIPAEDRPTIITQRVPAHLVFGSILDLKPQPYPAPRTCISCGAKTDEHGALPCGH